MKTIDEIQPDDRMTWWLEARFGLFIHWGLYAVPARGEWLQAIAKIPAAEYDRYCRYFDMDAFNPVNWARAAKRAGMKYMVFTAKHHDGFCMWDSKFTDYKSRRDVLRETLDAFRAEGLRVGIYYSLIDWHHSDFTIDDNHPRRDDGDWAVLNCTRNQKRYCAYMRDQITELLTEYGTIDVLWFDFTYPRPTGKCADDWDAEQLLALVRRLAPEIVINDRLGISGTGDFRSPEQYVPEDGIRDAAGRLFPWEGCQTFAESWGYHRDESNWKSSRQLIAMLVNHVSRGGNLLLNAGPDARGRFDERVGILWQALGSWLTLHGDAVYGCGVAPAEFPEPPHCRYTFSAKNRRLYLHIIDYPVKFIEMKNLAGKVDFARFLHDASEVRLVEFSRMPHGNMQPELMPDSLVLELPAMPPETAVPVIELFLK